MTTPRWLPVSLLWVLSVSCSRTDPGGPKAPGTEATATPIAAPSAQEVADSGHSLRAERLPSCEGMGYSLGLEGSTPARVQARFGRPVSQESFRVEERQGEFYGAIANTYPTTDPKNRNVLLEEWTWASDDCFLTVWFHRPHGTWQVLYDFFWNREIAF